jgi:hypothetical protein
MGVNRMTSITAIFQNALPEAVGALIATAFLAILAFIIRVIKDYKNPTLGKFLDVVKKHFKEIDKNRNVVFHDLITDEFDEIYLKIENYSKGVIEYYGETWRNPWQKILEKDDVLFYYSVALVKSENYWQDNPGKSAIDFNKELAKRKKIKRIFILWDSVWTSDKIKQWIKSQKESGIEIAVIPKTELLSEENLLYDLGIYGNVAVGYQYFDSDCKTKKFEFHFNTAKYNSTLKRFYYIEAHTRKEITDSFLLSY